MAPDSPDSSMRRHRPVVLAAVVVAIAYSWMAGHFATFTRPAQVATFIPGLLGVLVAIRRTPTKSARADRSGVGWLTWWLIVIGLGAIEVISLVFGSTHRHPTMSDLVNPWLLSTPSRAVGFALWLAFGYCLSRR